MTLRWPKLRHWSNTREAQRDGVAWVLFRHGWSTSRLGKTTARSVVRTFMRSTKATPLIERVSGLPGEGEAKAAVMVNKGGHIMMLNGQMYVKSVVSVGAGRGFIVAGSQDRRYVITAAHCLPKMPPPHLGRFDEECTFPMLGPLGQEPHMMAACVFVDAMADLAVLGAPDNQTFFNEAEEYEGLTTALPAMALAAPPPTPKAREFTVPPDTLDFKARTAWFEKRRLAYEQYLKQLERRAWMLSLDGHWFACAVAYSQDGSTLITKGSESVVGGMSGSPIITDEGAAMALVSTSGGDATQGPGLIDGLPGWLLDIMLADVNPRRRS